MIDGPGGRDARAAVLADQSLRGSELCRALSDWADAWLTAQLPTVDGALPRTGIGV